MGAAAWPRSRGNRAAVQIDNPPTGGQTQPQPRVLGAEEGLEDAVRLFPRQPASVVENFENVLAGPSPEELTTGVVMTQPQQEALVILFAGGKDNLDEGYQKMMAANKRQVNEYMQRLEVAGLGDRRERMNPMMRAALN